MKKTILVAGLAWGDEGKGAAVDFLCRKHNASLVIRYNGGHQAAHNVVLPDGRHHTFSQFGSGTLIPGVSTHLTGDVMINPLAMANENIALKNIGIDDAFSRLTVSSDCLIVTLYDKMLNRLKESINNHGSCGLGIGETKLYNNMYGTDSLFAGDLFDDYILLEKLKLRQSRAYDMAKNHGLDTSQFKDSIEPMALSCLYKEFIANHPQFNVVNNIAIIQHDVVVFEGAQGVLLDEREEFAPHNTWSKTTFENADKFLDGYRYEGERIRVGCIRCYMTRHGNGPMTNEDKRLDVLSEPHNIDTGFQGKFRRGHFDMSAIRHALTICDGVDEIHMSHVDHMPVFFHRISDTDTEIYIRNIERLLHTPITVLGYGPTYLDRKERGKRFVAGRRFASAGTGVSCGTEG